jgi:hypothetical protein
VLLRASPISLVAITIASSVDVACARVSESSTDSRLQRIMTPPVETNWVMNDEYLFGPEE